MEKKARHMAQQGGHSALAGEERDGVSHSGPAGEERDGVGHSGPAGEEREGVGHSGPAGEERGSLRHRETLVSLGSSKCTAYSKMPYIVQFQSPKYNFRDLHAALESLHTHSESYI